MGEIGILGGVVFIPHDTRGVLNQLMQRHAVPGGTFEFGYISGDLIIDRFDLAFFDRYTNQDANHGLCHGAGRPECARRIIFAVILIHDFAIF
ncbi:hypothetical protein D3C80_1751480 [compost metagenome]